MNTKVINAADRCAVVLSALCAVHCLLLPIAIFLIPTLATAAFFNNEDFHLWLLYAVLPISIFALGFGYLSHKNTYVIGVTGAGMVILLFAALAGHDMLGEQGEIIASVIGAILVTYGHVQNFKIRKAL
ncbi:MerC domain-containing protein [Paraglaciecola sp. 2405UD69-4]|uniref:MerC domain-containing protein n=1 Tax=Paraglaciecola sp. 2405UD69-4 TaxID=3391836 RepID=UPI0039C9C596